MSWRNGNTQDSELHRSREKIHSRPQHIETTQLTNGLQSLDFSGSLQKVLSEREENDGQKGNWNCHPIIGSNGSENDGSASPEKL